MCVCVCVCVVGVWVCVCTIIYITIIFYLSYCSEDGRVLFHVTMPDTITTWVLQAIGVSNTTGFGLTPPFTLKSFKSLFVSIKLPYSAQRGEQVSVIATVYNYQNNLRTVRD